MFKKFKYQINNTLDYEKIRLIYKYIYIYIHVYIQYVI